MSNLVNLYNSKHLGHAYLLHGKKGIGKATLAYWFSKAILTSPENNINLNQLKTASDSYLLPDNNNIALVASGAHPNILSITPEWDAKTQSFKGQITISQTRQIGYFIASTSLDNDKYPKIVIIDSINDMNINAANALLKILEDPQPNRVFLLVCHNLSQILPTIKSRCSLMNLPPLNTTEVLSVIKNLLRNSNQDSLAESDENELKSEFNSILQEGSVGNIINFFNPDIQTLYNLAQKAISTKDINYVYELSEKVRSLNNLEFSCLLEYLMLNRSEHLESYLSSKTLTVKEWLEQNKLLNLDKSNIITCYILSLI